MEICHTSYMSQKIFDNDLVEICKNKLLLTNYDLQACIYWNVNLYILIKY